MAHSRTPCPAETRRAQPGPASRRCPRPAAPAGSAAACCAGTTGTAAICRGGGPTTRTTSSCRRSCCSRPRWTGCCPSTTSGSTSTRRSRRWPTRPRRPRSKTWYPLGYNIRPRRLHAIARESVARFGGELPSDEETLRSFKGIGPYTAGALMSFAFRQAGADPRHQRGARPVPRGHRPRQPEVAPDAEAPLDGLGADGAAQARVRLQPGASWTSGRSSARRASRSATRARCPGMCRAYPFDPGREGPASWGQLEWHVSASGSW